MCEFRRFSNFWTISPSFADELLNVNGFLIGFLWVSNQSVSPLIYNILPFTSHIHKTRTVIYESMIKRYFPTTNLAVAIYLLFFLNLLMKHHDFLTLFLNHILFYRVWNIDHIIMQVFYLKRSWENVFPRHQNTQTF